MTWKIRAIVVEALIEASRHTHPDEFMALLGGDAKRELITELVILLMSSGETHATIRTDLLPLNDKTVGSCHSHPGYDNRPSRQDRATFRELGSVHLIVCEPFSLQTIAAYNAQGKKMAFEIVPNQSI